MWITSFEQLRPYLWNVMIQTGFTLIPALALIPVFLMGAALFLVLHEGATAIEAAPPPRTFGSVVVRSHLLGALGEAALCVYLPCILVYYVVRDPLMELLPDPVENPDWPNHPLARSFDFFLLSSFGVLAAAFALTVATFVWLCYRASQAEVGSLLRVAFHDNWLIGAAVVPIGTLILNPLLQNLVFLAMLIHPPPPEILHASYPLVWQIVPVFMVALLLGALALLFLPVIWLVGRATIAQLGYLALSVSMPLQVLAVLGLLALVVLAALLLLLAKVGGGGVGP